MTLQEYIDSIDAVVKSVDIKQQGDGFIISYITTACGKREIFVPLVGTALDGSKRIENQIIDSDGILSLGMSGVQNSDAYKSDKGVESTNVWTELDLILEFTECSIVNTGDGVLQIKLDSEANDIIELTPEGTLDSSLQIDYGFSKIFHYAPDGDTTFRYIVTR
ncbi:MAG: hypothetical protein ACTSQZ_02010 [Candidatus Thorarchaeota archaeon]